MVAGGTEYMWIGGIDNGNQHLRIVPGLDMVVVTAVDDYSQCIIQKQAETLFNGVIVAMQPTPH